MKKIFVLFLAFSLLFLTACNLTPPSNTTDSGSSSSSTDQNSTSGGTTDSSTTSGTPAKPNPPGEDPPYWDWRELQDQVVFGNSKLINIPSRILYEASHRYTYYYSKADETAYIYCFDPLCDHTQHTCLARPAEAYPSDWRLQDTYFINNRFYCVSDNGLIWSFSFDGSDKKVEYDAKYDRTDITQSFWERAYLYGPYIYIDSTATGPDHLLRFNVETKEMEDLTKKNRNYIYPFYFYNGMIYGWAADGVTRCVADMDLKNVELDENPVSPYCSTGNYLVGEVRGEEIDPSWGIPFRIGIEIYNLKTKERVQILNETLGMESIEIIGATDQYIYFYDSKRVSVGTITITVGGVEREATVTKWDDGKIWRMNLDGTNIVCVYDNIAYDLTTNAVFYEDRIVMQGEFIGIEDGKKKVWGGPLQVAVINEDGTFGEFREVEVVG